MQNIAALSVTEAETIAVLSCVQDILCNRRVLMLMGLKVELPIHLDVDNSGAVDPSNDWSPGKRTRYVEVRTFFIRYLKEEEIIGTN